MSHDPRHPADDPALERALEDAWAASPEPGRGRAAPDAVREAMGTFRRQRRRRVSLAATGCVLLVGLGLWIARPAEESPSRVQKADALAYGRDLYRRVFGKPNDQSDDNVDLVRGDTALRAELFEALDHESSFVRRIAIELLGHAAVKVPPEVMERMLLENREDLVMPIDVASIGDSGRAIASELERGRRATVQRVLGAAFVMAATGQRPLRIEVIEPWIEHEDPHIRHEALVALMAREDYKPSETVWTLFLTDENFMVRQWAFQTLRRRLGEAAHPRLFEIFKTINDPYVESPLLHELRDVTGIEAVVRARLDLGIADTMSRLTHLQFLYKRGDKDPLNAELARLIPKAEAGTLRDMTHMIAALELIELRAPLIRRIKELAPEPIRSTAHQLFRWDERSGDTVRLIESINLLGRVGGRFQVRVLEPMLKHEDRAVVAAAKAAIEAIRAR